MPFFEMTKNNQLFDIERDLKDVSPEERYNKRLERSRPILFQHGSMNKYHEYYRKVHLIRLLIIVVTNVGARLEVFLQD